MGEIRRFEVYKEEPIQYDLIAPEGKLYKSKVDGYISEKVIFKTFVFKNGIKLDKPFKETIADYELVDSE